MRNVGVLMNFPNDEDGQVLAALEAHGVDLEQPLTLEFAILVGEDTAPEIKAKLIEHGFDAEISYDEGEEYDDEDDAEEFGPSWSVIITHTLIPTYQNIVDFQRQIGAIVEPLGGELDGWGVLLDS